MIQRVKYYCKEFIKRLLAYRGWVLIKKERVPVLFQGEEYGPLPLWNERVEFMNLYQKIHDHTMVDIVRCYLLYQLALQNRILPGDAAEIGVWRGGTGKLLATLLPKKAVYLFDTFEGLPAITPKFDLAFHQQGMFNDAIYDEVCSYLKQLTNVRLIKGVFPSSAQSLSNVKMFSFVHVDVDLYQSAHDCLTYFYERLVDGGVMVFDDYGFGSCPGVKTAVDTFFAATPEQPLYLPSGQCVIFKRVCHIEPT